MGQQALGGRRAKHRCMAATGLKPGDVIESRYEILQQIGLGGMGAVWKIHHREWDRELALKMPLAQLVGSPALRERFVREAETWVGLGVHPNIVQCWYVLNISGLPCLFLDFMKGGSLKDRLLDGTIAADDWPTMLQIAIQVAQGLGHAHSRGVIHRDIKPENLLFRDPGRICVTDFGLVKTVIAEGDLRESESGHQMPEAGTTISGVGAYLGTPQYGAPEQWGAAETVGPGADIYALGVTLYEMCAGRRPYDKEGDTVHYGDLINAHLSIAPPDPREFRPDIPAKVAEICLQCLAKKVEQRPASMDDLIGSLSSIYRELTGSTIQTVASLPKADNPDILNNMAVSFVSLDKNEDARRLLQRALRVEPDHSEALYNLSQLDRREGRIGMQEALRRLQQAKLNYPLALLCIEQGLGKEAATILSEIETEDPIKKGLVQRALGDAQMYAQQYFAAEQAYQSALKLMPNDQQSTQRKPMAVQGKRDLNGRVLFPHSRPSSNIATGIRSMKLVVNDNSTRVLGVTEREFWGLELSTDQMETRTPRLEDARPVDKMWTAGQRLVVQERGAFQLRMLPDFRMIGRKGGVVLAVASDLSRMVLLSREGPSLYVGDENAFHNISKANQAEGQPTLLAAFDRSGQLLCLLLPSGRVAQLDESYEALPMAWPPTRELPKDPTALALSRLGVLYVGNAKGEVKAFDTSTQSVSATYQLPGAVHQLSLLADDQRLMADLGGYHVLLETNGHPVWQGPGPLSVDSAGTRLLFFHRGQLHLYEILPFQLVRRWDFQVEKPVGLHLGRNGSHAVSWDQAGNIQLWDVDEDHRVYERSLLLSPGRSFDDLVAGAQAFPVALELAKQSAQNGELLEAYRQLLKARAVSGYGQQPEALDLNWILLNVMGRDQLDAIWDRLTLSGKHAGPVDIAPEGNRYLTTFGQEISVVSDSAAGSAVLWTQSRASRVLAARFHTHHDGRIEILVVDTTATAAFLDPKTGVPSREFSLGNEALIQVQLTDKQALFLTSSGIIGSCELSNGKRLQQEHALTDPPSRIFPWLGGQVIAVGEAGFGLVNLSKRGGSNLEPFSPKSYQPTAAITFAHLDSRHRVLVLGLEDGTLAIVDASDGRLIYAISKVSGAVTGFALVSSMNVGIVSTDRGQLYFWDLLADRVLEGILAHRGGIIDLRVDDQGRFLVTSGQDGQVRLWETSWTLSLSLQRQAKLQWLPTDGALSKLSRFFRRS